MEAQNNLKRMSYVGRVTLFKNAAKPHSLLLVHAYGHVVTGLKTYRGPKRKEQFGVCSLPGLTSKVEIFASLDGMQSDTPGEPTPLGRVHSWVSKSHQTGV